MQLKWGIVNAALIVLAGVVSGGALFIFGIAMSGLGHGWTAGASVAIEGAYAAPAAAVAWLVRHRRPGRILAGVIVLLNLFMDVTALEESLNAERGMVYRVWEAMPGIVVFAAVLLVVWQLLPIATLVFSKRAAPPPDSLV